MLTEKRKLKWVKELQVVINNHIEFHGYVSHYVNIIILFFPEIPSNKRMIKMHKELKELIDLGILVETTTENAENCYRLSTDVNNIFNIRIPEKPTLYMKKELNKKRVIR